MVCKQWVLDILGVLVHNDFRNGSFFPFLQLGIPGKEDEKNKKLKLDETNNEGGGKDDTDTVLGIPGKVDEKEKKLKLDEANNEGGGKDDTDTVSRDTCEEIQSKGKKTVKRKSSLRVFATSITSCFDEEAEHDGDSDDDDENDIAYESVADRQVLCKNCNHYYSDFIACECIESKNQCSKSSRTQLDSNETPKFRPQRKRRKGNVHHSRIVAVDIPMIAYKFVFDVKFKLSAEKSFIFEKRRRRCLAYNSLLMQYTRKVLASQNLAENEIDVMSKEVFNKFGLSPDRVKALRQLVHAQPHYKNKGLTQSYVSDDEDNDAYGYMNSISSSSSSSSSNSCSFSASSIIDHHFRSVHFSTDGY